MAAHAKTNGIDDVMHVAGARTFLSAAVSEGDLGLNFGAIDKVKLAADRNVRAPVIHLVFFRLIRVFRG